MKRRFVIGIDALDAGQEKQFRGYIAKQGASWWHWIGNMWLLTTDHDEPSAAKIRDFLLKINPNARIVVFEFPEDIDWAGSASKNASGKKLADWLFTTWGSR